MVHIVWQVTVILGTLGSPMQVTYSSLLLNFLSISVSLKHKQKLDDIGLKLNKAFQSQLFFKARESRHKHTVDGNNNKVQWLSILVCCVMVAVGFLQVVLIRNLFRTSRKDRIRT